jgi:activator of 2-hydroxyglutaryl-CoA dehydratase
MDCYLGVDIGSVSSNFVLIDHQNRVLEKLYIRTQGNPVKAIKNGYEDIVNQAGDNLKIKGIGTTGSWLCCIAEASAGDVWSNSYSGNYIDAGYQDCCHSPHLPFRRCCC